MNALTSVLYFTKSVVSFGPHAVISISTSIGLDTCYLYDLFQVYINSIYTIQQTLQLNPRETSL